MLHEKRLYPETMKQYMASLGRFCDWFARRPICKKVGLRQTYMLGLEDKLKLISTSLEKDITTAKAKKYESIVVVRVND
jgi:hypothetical protein